MEKAVAVPEPSLLSNFLSLFNSLKNECTPPSAFLYLLLPIHWGMVYLLKAMFLLRGEEKTKQLKNLHELITTFEDGNRSIELDYEGIHFSSRIRLKIIEKVKDKLIFASVVQDGWNKSETVMINTAAYIKNAQGNTVDEVYHMWRFYEIGFLMKNKLIPMNVFSIWEVLEENYNSRDNKVCELSSQLTKKLNICPENDIADQEEAEMLDDSTPT